jgi:hypothetical protein
MTFETKKMFHTRECHLWSLLEALLLLEAHQTNQHLHLLPLLEHLISLIHPMYHILELQTRHLLMSDH